MKLHSTLIPIPLLFTLLSCQGLFEENSTESLFEILNPAETFESTDAPISKTYDSLTFKTPWGYDKAENVNRNYPLLVSGY